jgi:hypothetical protein
VAVPADSSGRTGRFRGEGALLGALKEFGIAPQRVVLEVLEQPNLDPKRLVAAVEMARRHGFLIALDEFGAGHSNIDRVWQLQPDIVKLDRSMVFQATQQTHVERILPGLVSLLHESGRLVLIKGIESEQEALIALDANADLLQGHYFARPSVAPVDPLAIYKTMDGLAERYRHRIDQAELDNSRYLQPYIDTVQKLAERRIAGLSLADASGDFLALPDAARCFELDARGRQIGDNVLPPRPMRQRARRFMPLLNSEGARWDRRSYFRSALRDPGAVQVTQPYLSINEAHLCVTLSIAIGAPDSRVLCADVDWSRHDRSNHAPAH